MPVFHPRNDEHGKPVLLKHPSVPSPAAAWQTPAQAAAVLPDGVVPGSLNGLALRAWTDLPDTAAGWEKLAEACAFSEPDFAVPSGKKPASGAVVVEPDGRVWAVSPSNQFGGYTTTFPKGTLSAKEKLSLRANAIKEVHEESGLKIELTGFLVDVPRSLSFTRYYVGRRIGGNPADMGWESQSVHLIPRDLLPKVVGHTNDVPILEALEAYLARPDAAGAGRCHWSDDRYWLDALERYQHLRSTGNDFLMLDLRSIDRALFDGDSPAFRLVDAMASVRESEGADGMRGAPRLVLALLMRLAQYDGRVARPI
jgi:8-oxo-dGTP pyrophosphatase MutT (NUDIX family)